MSDSRGAIDGSRRLSLPADGLQCGRCLQLTSGIAAITAPCVRSRPVRPRPARVAHVRRCAVSGRGPRPPRDPPHPRVDRRRCGPRRRGRRGGHTGTRTGQIGERVRGLFRRVLTLREESEPVNDVGIRTGRGHPAKDLVASQAVLAIEDLGQDVVNVAHVLNVPVGQRLIAQNDRANAIDAAHLAAQLSTYHASSPIHATARHIVEPAAARRRSQRPIHFARLTRVSSLVRVGSGTRSTR